MITITRTPELLCGAGISEKFGQNAEKTKFNKQRGEQE
jgi:hypothetical protein